MATKEDLAYAVSGKYIGAFNVQTGQAVWNARVQGSWFGYGIASIAVIGETVVVGKDGKVFGYDRHTGQLLWENRLEGSGAYATIIAGGANGSAALSSSAAAQSASAVAIIAATSAASMS